MSATFVNAAERTVWEAITAQAPADWIVLPNVRLTNEGKDHEVDVLVLAPELGVIAVEVKGGSIFIEDNVWRQDQRTGSKVIHPVDQARKATFAIREYVESDPRWGARRRVLFSHAVAFPHTAADADFSHPDCPRWKIHGRDDLHEIAGRLATALRKQSDQQRPPSHDDCSLIADILQGRNLPVRDVVAAALEHEDRADRLTAEQASLLKVTRLLNRVEVRGGAGSGKTVLAQAQAKELSAGGNGRPAQRVALLCYSLGLATGTKRVTDSWNHRKRPAFVGSFEELGRYLGVTEFADRDNSDFWESELPRQMTELAAALPEGKKFDAVVVDEAQDFAHDWWDPLLGILRDPEKGGLYAYSDEHQRVFARFGRPSVAMVPLVLDRNLRNTKEIAETFRPLAPTGMTLSDYSGPEATLVETSAAQALEAADDQVEALIDEGWRPQDIALLSTGRRHPEQVSAQERGQDHYWSTFWDEDVVFYGHVLGCKGLERRCVVLAVNDQPDSERARERLYVGLSRATERLVVVGDPDAIAQVGGPSVLAKLTRQD